MFPSLGRMGWSRKRRLTAAQLNINCKGWEFGQDKIFFASSHFGKLNVFLSKSGLSIIYPLPKFPACCICPWDTFITYKFCSVFPVTLPQISKAYKIIMCSVLQTNVANTWRVKRNSNCNKIIVFQCEGSFLKHLCDLGCEDFKTLHSTSLLPWKGCSGRW